MMNGHEKSDSVIVAEKPANKAAPSAVEQSAVELAVAEPVERRAETKGNADQQSTCRAQSRVSVSQARDRIRTGSSGERIGHCRRGGSTYPSRTVGSARSRLRPWRTRSSSGRWSRC